MQCKRKEGHRSKTPFKGFIEVAKADPLSCRARAPRIPGPNQRAPAWDVPDELAIPHTPRTLKKIHDFEDSGQDLLLSCYKYFESVSPDLMIDWNAPESRNIRLSAHGIRDHTQGRDVDDLRSFREAIFGSIIVTAMEMARLLGGEKYQESYRYSRDSAVNHMRGARWDVLPYAKTKTSTNPDGNQTPKMVVICIPPWDLSKLDLEEFTTQRTFSAGELKFTPGEMNTLKAYILWAIVYDACKEANCSYFVVTNYDYWVFGNTSRDYASASVSPVFDFSERSSMCQLPNLLQLLTYWELASIGAVTWDVPTA